MTNAYPLTWPDGWPRTHPSKRAISSPFRTTFAKARSELLWNLDLMGATHAVISSCLPLRNDGLPRADCARMRIDDPGVAVYFRRRGASMVMARDAYWNVHDNLRSISLAAEHLRGLERHGGATMMERAFEGFVRLPAPDSFDPWTILGLRKGEGRQAIEARFRELAKRHHPDVGGNADAFAAIVRARDLALNGGG